MASAKAEAEILALRVARAERGHKSTNAKTVPTKYQLPRVRVWVKTRFSVSSSVMRESSRRGALSLVQIGRGAVDSARVLKPLIPNIGAYGIEIHDEIELEYAPAAQPWPARVFSRRFSSLSGPVSDTPRSRCAVA